MRVVFIFVVILLLIGMAVPVAFAVQIWLDGRAVIERAEARGAFRSTPAGRLSMAEYTVAMNEFRETWRTSAMPCRTLANLWDDVTTESAPQTTPVSHKYAGVLMGERREGSIRWQVRRLIVACQLEQQFDDRQMLRLWLAQASFGRDVVGLENAAQAVFSKPSTALNRDESARLAVLLRAPSLRGQPERWTERAAQVEARVAAAR